MNRLCSLTLLALIGVSQIACSVVYDEARTVNNKACEKYPNTVDRNDCLKKSDIPYEKYEAQRKADGRTEADKKSEKSSAKPLCYTRSSSGETVCAN